MNRRSTDSARSDLAANPAVRLFVAVALLFLPAVVRAAGTLTPAAAGAQPISIRKHSLDVVIDNGFAQTTVTQLFVNPNDTPQEALYSFPLPKSASLSETTVRLGEKTIEGEVVPAPEAQKTYEAERDAGHEAGLASKDGIQAFEFRVSPIPPHGEAEIRFVYYQPLEIDTGVGRYLYPLREGGTDDAAVTNFWNRNDAVDEAFSVHVRLKSAWPVDDVRIPGFEQELRTQKAGPGDWTLDAQKGPSKLDRDVVLYYRLAEGLPGRADLVTYRKDPKSPGTFLAVLTPGVDLQPLTRGSDWVFVLDVSGSMAQKLGTLAQGVAKTLGQMKAGDRFRIVKFASSAADVTHGYIDATPENVKRGTELVSNLSVEGGTNLYEGVKLGLSSLDADRATSILLVTDGVTNEGLVEPAEFRKLVSTYDVRIFGFVMGNSANWPLMEILSQVTGGFTAGISNDDDITGQILLAKSKLTSESLHDVEVTIRGGEVRDRTDEISKRNALAFRKIYRGQQIVLFGRYEKPGPVEIVMKAKLTGADQVYRTTAVLPEVDRENPELERLWALAQVEAVDRAASLGDVPRKDADDRIRKLGVDYQIVTDQTSMLVLTDEAFERFGIARNNRDRVARERAAQAVRAANAPAPKRVDTAAPMFPSTAPTLGGGRSHGGGGGAIDPISAGVAGLLALSALARRRRNRS